MPFEIIVLPDAMEHLAALTVGARRTILDRIEEQLPYQPTAEARNRKQLRPNQLARWELRVGEFRVFYNVIESEMKVYVVAVGHKDHEKLFIGGKEHQL